MRSCLQFQTIIVAMWIQAVFVVWASSLGTGTAETRRLGSPGGVRIHIQLCIFMWLPSSDIGPTCASRIECTLWNMHMKSFCFVMSSVCDHLIYIYPCSSRLLRWLCSNHKYPSAQYAKSLFLIWVYLNTRPRTIQTSQWHIPRICQQTAVSILNY